MAVQDVKECREYNILFATAFSLIGAAQLLIKQGVHLMSFKHMTLRHKVKQALTQFSVANKRFQYCCDVLSEVAVDNGRPLEEDMDIVTAHIADNNTMARVACLWRNATSGPNGEENGIKIESYMLLLAKGNQEISNNSIDTFYMK